MEHFKKLNAINVNDKTEAKKNLTYLSWTFAWSETKKVYPDATYKIKRSDFDTPYIFDPNLGYMVFTEVTIEGLTHEMWLPVMDGANKAMKNESYTYETKFGEKTVQAASMFDINKTIMRCLTKNLAMFGLGLYIYSGEDLPELTDDSIRDKIDAVSKCDTIVRLQKHWKANEQLHKNEEFINAVNEQKAELSALNQEVKTEQITK